MGGWGEQFFLDAKFLKLLILIKKNAYNLLKIIVGGGGCMAPLGKYIARSQIQANYSHMGNNLLPFCVLACSYKGKLMVQSQYKYTTKVCNLVISSSFHIWSHSLV